MEAAAHRCDKAVSKCSVYTKHIPLVLNISLSGGANLDMCECVSMLRALMTAGNMLSPSFELRLKVQKF